MSDGDRWTTFEDFVGSRKQIAEPFPAEWMREEAVAIWQYGTQPWYVLVTPVGSFLAVWAVAEVEGTKGPVAAEEWADFEEAEQALWMNVAAPAGAFTWAWAFHGSRVLGLEWIFLHSGGGRSCWCLELSDMGVSLFLDDGRDTGFHVDTVHECRMRCTWHSTQSIELVGPVAPYQLVEWLEGLKACMERALVHGDPEPFAKMLGGNGLV